MKMKINEMTRVSEGDIVELEGTVSHAQEPREGQYGWSQFIGVEDNTGEQNCWIRLEGEEDKVTKGTSISIKGKLGEEYKDKRTKEMVRSINNCEFEVGEKVEEKETSRETVEKNGKVDGKVWEEKDLRMARESALKNVTQFVVAKIVKLKDRFEYAQEDVDFIYKDMVATKEERIEEAREAVGESEFNPASDKQLQAIFGYGDEEGWYKGFIESRYITKEEIRHIGTPKELSIEKASKIMSWWWGEDKEEGERMKRERENPRDKLGNLAKKTSKLEENLRPGEPILKGDKTSLVKDELIDEINAWRRENFLISDKKFKEEFGYSGNLEKLSEEDLLKIKKLIKHWSHPKDWDK